MTNPPRLQPAEVAVLEQDPFANDLLGRKPFVEALTEALKGVSGPAVFSIDGSWGTGKTTFVRMLAQHLDNQGFTVVAINAWQTDHGRDPLAVLVSQFVQDLKPRSEARARLSEAFAAVRRSRLIPLLSQLAGQEALGAVLEQFAARVVDGTQALCVTTFRESVKNLVTQASCRVVVLVDELDRCRPTYAIEMLEVIKHLFDVDDLLFVVACNRAQLDVSVTALYGPPVDKEGYFGRIFDIELALPVGTKEQHMATRVRELGLAESDMPARMLVAFLTASPMSARTCERALLHYDLVSKSLPSDQSGGWWWALIAAILLRHLDPEAYRQFNLGMVDDGGVVEQLFDHEWAGPLRNTQEGAVFIAAMVVAHAHISRSPWNSSVLLAHAASQRSKLPLRADDALVPIEQLCSSLATSPPNSHWPWPRVVERIELLGR